MSKLEKRKLGRTDAYVTRIGLGCAPLGDLFVPLSEEQAQQTLQAAWDGGVRYFDTAPFYGYGKSEHRVGTFLRQQPRDEFVVSTKIGRVMRRPHNLTTFDKGMWAGGLSFEFDYDYSYDGIMRSYEDSLQRLSIPSIDILLVHDLDIYFHKSEAKFNAYLYQLVNSGWRALDELRSSGEVKAVGAGINTLDTIPRFLDVLDMDTFIVAGAYNLLDQSMLDSELPLCAERGIEVIIGAVFASGILATGAVEGATFQYEPASEEILQRTRQIEAVCQRHQIPLPAVSLQFLLAHPTIATLIPGALEPHHISSNIHAAEQSIPAVLWAELKDEGLLRHDAPTP
ncbi:MAG: aldo/keto reductase [Chloroflexota bacterium]